MNEELRIQRCRQYGSFLYCPTRDTLCFGRDTDQECKYESCILDDPKYQALQKTIAENRRKREKNAKETAAWEKIHELEAKAKVLYRKNKPKIADGLMADAMYLRRCLAEGGEHQ